MFSDDFITQAMSLSLPDNLPVSGVIRPQLEREIYGGHQRIYQFSNGYGASVVFHEGSYGSGQGKCELAVLVDLSLDPLSFELCYDTPITNDVLGYLDEEEVQSLLVRIQSLPVR